MESTAASREHEMIRRLGVWESEGGHIDASRAATTRQARAWWPAARLADLTPGSAVHVDVDGHAICLVNSGGDVHALRDECSHGQVRLSEGDVLDGLIECWQHGSCFDLATGEPTGPPATVRVPVYPARVVDSVIQVELSSTRC